MKPEFSSSNSPVNTPADSYFIQGHYAEAATEYEQAIEHKPDQVSLYWRLGLALVLQGKEEEAQIAWMTPLLEAEPEQVEQWTVELLQELEAEAQRQEAKQAYEPAWLLRRHIQEFDPENAGNLLQVLYLALAAGVFSFEDDLLSEVIQQLSQEDATDSGIPVERLVPLTHLLLEFDPKHSDVLSFLEACLPYMAGSDSESAFINLLLRWTTRCQDRSLHKIAIELGRICIRLAPNDPKVLAGVIPLLQSGKSENLLEAVELAERYQQISTRIMDRIIATEWMLASWMYSGGNWQWQRTIEICQTLEALLQELISSYTAKPKPQNLEGINSGESLSETQDLGFLANLVAIGLQFLYITDSPSTFRPLRNQLGAIAQTELQAVLQEEATRYQQRIQTRFHSSIRTRLPKIGYLSASFQQHSVGWLCRWLLKYHDRDRFDIHLYSSRSSNDFIQQGLIAEYGDHFHPLSSVVAEMTNQIADDDIDILIELDSLTNFGGCGVVALKPAPIQVHWLGYDSSGIPAVDYFIADPYVLPEEADNYYSEKIWRLPQTYIAVDGFEVHIPSLRRDHLNIPSDAVVFLSSQTGMKRNPENARLQMQILREVPNSYFLVKSFRANPEFTENFFREMAEQEGVSFDRLRFLPTVPSEFTHRANLAIADVVLDTYPYNGATTTLEALWMGLPIVTRVGEQFAARNSYTMMMNVGVTEGLAWSNKEYLEWGVRLGTDTALRQDIFYRLQRSRHTSPLWNGKQFAREMETAYEQMWQQYCKG